MKEYHKKYIKEYKRKQYELNPLKMKEKRRIRFYKDYYNLTLEQVNEIKKNGCFFLISKTLFIYFFELLL